MLSGSITRRYARALFDAAAERNALEGVAESFVQFAQTVVGHAELRAVLENPTVAQDKKLQIVQAVFEDGLHPFVSRMLEILFERGRSDYMIDVAQDFHELADERQGRMEVQLETAAPLGDEQLASITATVGSRLHKTVTAHVTQRPELLAGYKLRIGNHVIDATLKGMLTGFSQKLSVNRLGKEGLS